MSGITLRITIILGLMLFAWTAEVRADQLKRHSQIGLKIGAQTHGERNMHSDRHFIENSAGSGDMLVGLAYVRWMQKNLAVTFNLSLITSEALNGVGGPVIVSNKAFSVSSILLGARYYLPESTLKSSVRPYFAAGIGPYIGNIAKNEVDIWIVNSSKTLTAFGGHVGGGVDIQLNSRFMIGLNAGLNLMTDFSEQVGGRHNYSGFEVGLGIGFLFGKDIR